KQYTLMGEDYTHSDTEDKLFPSKITLNSRGKLLLLNEPWIMGIINITPDSFYAESRTKPVPSEIIQKAEKMISDGARVLDIGGYSSRPGAAEVPVSEELQRVLPAIQVIKKAFPDVLLSIDTFRSEVAREAVKSGCDIVNDISGGGLDPEMIPTVGQLDVPYICMHMRGKPENMATLTEYENLEKDLLSRSEEHTSELQSRENLVCRLLLEKKK